MNRVNLPFDRFAYPLVIGFVGQSKLMNEDVSAFSPVGCDALVLRFDEYIKSQIHLNIERPFFGESRSLKAYVDAFDALNVGKHSEELFTVYKYFIEDMKNFLINWAQPSGVKKIEIVSGIKGADRCILSQANVEKFVQDCNNIDEFVNSSDSWLISYVQDLEDLKNRKDFLYLACILNSFKADRFVDFIWEENNES